VSYRTKEEVAEWKERDPVSKLRNDSIAAGLASEEDFKRIDEEIRDVVEESAEFALASPLETDSTAMDHVFYSPAE
jgi:pyruvate dehydrogenase E1 component alpha subunit